MWWTTAWAWDVNGIDWTWQEAPVEEPFVLNTDSFADVADADRAEALFLAALETWNVESEADLHLVYGGRTTHTRQGGGDDGTNVTVFGSRDWWAGLAVATTGSSGRRLTDCDISVHRRNGYGTIDWYTDGVGEAPRGAFDLANTLTHELGHCLGLAHSYRASAMMSAYSVAGTGEKARHLTDDDREAIQFLYGHVAPELVLEDASAGPVVDGAVTVTLVLRNVGDGSAFGVWVETADAEVDAGAIGAPTPVGERVADDVLEVPVDVAVDCASTTLDLMATATDARGRSWDMSASVALECPATPGGPRAGAPRAAAGCGCDGAATPGPLAAALVLLLRRRATGSGAGAGSRPRR